MVASSLGTLPPDPAGVHADVWGSGGAWTWVPRHADGRLAWDAIGIHMQWNQHGGFHSSEQLAREASERGLGNV